MLAFAPPGFGGLAVITCSETLTLLAAGVFNPTYTTHRMNVTEDGFMARVSSSWSIGSKSVQPVFIAVGGLLSLVLSIRITLAVAGILCAASFSLLPWRSDLSAAGEADRDRDGAADGDGERSGVGQLRDDPGHGRDEPVEPLAELSEDGIDRGAADTHHRLGLNLGTEMVDAADGRTQVHESGAR
jgi:hypothetical protein